MTTQAHTDADAALFGNRFITQDVPSREFPAEGMPAADAMRLVFEDLAIEGDPAHNPATFVTTWMEPEAQRIIAANLHRNFIDHAEYPRTAEIEQRCIRMLADLFHAPGRRRGHERRIIGGDHARRAVAEVEVEGAPPGRRRADDESELVFGGDVHVVWESSVVTSTSSRASCRSSLESTRSVLTMSFPTSTRTPSASRPCSGPHSPGTRTTSSASTTCSTSEERAGTRRSAACRRRQRRFVWPFLYPDSEWDLRLDQVRSINVSGHKFAGLPGRGLVDLPGDC